MSIRFSENMRIPSNLTLLKTEDYLDIYLAPSNNWTNYESYNISRLNFTWEIRSYSKSLMVVKLNFTDPNSISMKIK